jgi:hypothetical protein
MNAKKFLLGSLVGGIVFFFGGYLVYGMLLADFMSKNAGTASGVERPTEEMVMWALVVGNLSFGVLMSYVLNKANVMSISGGIVTGAIVGFLMSLGIDCVMYGTSNVMTTTMMMGDVAAMTGISAVAGAVITWVINLGSKD